MNEAYLNSDWFNGNVKLDRFTIRSYVLKMKDFGINTQICDIGLIDDSGKLFSENYATLQSWIATSREVDPTQSITVCLGYGRRRNGTVANPTFGTAKFNNNLNETIVKLLTTLLSFVDGIHLDIELFLDNDTRLLDTLRYLKYNSLQNTRLSLSTPANVWSPGFIQQVAAEIEELSPMIYDSMGWGSPVVDEPTYKAYYQQSLQKYTDAIGDLCDLVPIFPSYEKKMAGTVVYHDPAVETLSAAATVTKANKAKCIKGAAIFWYPHFAGYNPTQYNLFQRDQDAWNTIWRA